jgi:integrase
VRSSSGLKATSNQIPVPADVWLAWEHLATPNPNLSRITPSAALNPSGLSDLARSLLAIIDRELPEVLPTDARDIVADRSKLERLLAEVKELVEPDRGFVYQRRILEVIDRGNKCGRFRIPIPWIPAPLPPLSPSPFVHENFEALEEFTKLRAGFCESFKREQVLPPNAWWGRTFLSAVLYGGVLRPEWLLAIPAALFEKGDRRLRWLDLRLPIEPIPKRPQPAPPSASVAASSSEAPINVEPAFAIRRWFVDPLTRLLLATAPTGQLTGHSFRGRRPGDQVMRAMRDYIALCPMSAKLPGNFITLAAVAKTRMHLHLPPHLVEYLAGGYANTSLPVDSWNRLLHPPRRPAARLEDLPTGPKARQVLPIDGDNDRPTADQDGEKEEWVDQFHDLAVTVRNGGTKVRSAVQAWRRTNKGKLLSSVDLLAEWVEDWLLGRPQGRSPLGYSTIYQYLRTAGGRLVGLLADTDPANLLDEDAYIEAYESVLDQIDSTGDKRRAATALRLWHDFLVEKHGVPEIESSTVLFTGGKTLPHVDANIVGTDTFFRAMQLLRDEVAETDKTLADALCRIAALGFFAGLRRSEAIRLQLHDLRGRKHVALTVEPNGLRKLKTRNAYRNLPLSDLLPRIELGALLDWRDRRRSAGAGPDDLLFPDFAPKKGGRLRDSHPHLTLITSALQRAAHDRTLRFHHLRHSFSSWMLLKFWLAEQPGGSACLPVWFLPTEHDRSRWDVALKEREALLGSARTNRRGLLQISRLLGHSSVDITIASYVHVIDFISGLAITRLAPELDSRALKTIAGYQPRQFERIVSKFSSESGGPSGLSGKILSEIADRVLGVRPAKDYEARLEKVRILQPPSVQAPRDPLARLVHICKALYRIDALGNNLAEVAHNFDIPEKAVGEWWGRFRTASHIAKGVDKEVPEIHATVLGWPLTPKQLRCATRVYASIEHLEQHGIAQKVSGPHRQRGGVNRKLTGAAAAKIVLQVAEDFQISWQPGTALTVRVNDLYAAHRWLWFLAAVGAPLPKRAVQARTLGTPSPSAERKRRYWRERLGMPVEQSEHLGLPNVGASDGVFLEPSLKDRSRRTRRIRAFEELAGIRFVLAMLFILGRSRLA